MTMSLDAIKKNLNKKFKAEILGLGSCVPKIERIPFSSPRLNYLTRGGVPWPGIIEISGPEASGKSTLLADLTMQSQKKGLLCSLTDTENKVDIDYWKWLGVDVDNLLVCNPVGMSGEDILQLQLDLMAEGIQFLGLDSVASLVPKSVLNGDMEDKTYCGSSGIMSTFSQKISGSGIVNSKKITFVGINQVRDKIGGFGLHTPAGHFWKHICSCRIQLSRGNPFNEAYVQMPHSTQEQTSGHWIEVRLLKNQFTKNDRRFNMFTLHYTKGIDVVEDLIDVAIELKIIHKGGAWYRVIDPESGEIVCINDEELKFQGRASIRHFLNENPKILKWLETQVNSKITEV
jgi:recombination protein RecA